MSIILTEYNEELHNETLREEGREDGMEEGIKLTKTVFTLHISGKVDEDIAKAVDISLDKVKKILPFRNCVSTENESINMHSQCIKTRSGYFPHIEIYT